MDVVHGRGVREPLGLLVQEGLEHDRLEELPEDLGIGTEGPVRCEVVDAVEGHRGSQAGVRIFETGLEAGLVLR